MRRRPRRLGLLARKASIALQAVTGCTKTYLMLFAEAEGFGHLHVHVVPRMPDFEPEVLGPRVFAYLTDDESSWIPEGDARRAGDEDQGRCRHRALSAEGGT